VDTLNKHFDGNRALPLVVHYSASKATQLSLARSLAELTKGTPVSVDSVLPGPTEAESVKTFIKSVIWICPLPIIKAARNSLFRPL
jgi:short-subunit dehydrogenase